MTGMSVSADSGAGTSASTSAGENAGSESLAVGEAKLATVAIGRSHSSSTLRSQTSSVP